MSQRTRSDDTPYRWLERQRKRLGATMLASAVYDVFLALLGLLFPSWILRTVGLFSLQDTLCFRLWPLVHLIFPCFCVLAWMDTKRNVAIVSGAILARVVYALFTLLPVLRGHVHPAWVVVGGASLAWAVIHYAFLRLSDFGFWEVLSRAGNPPGIGPR